MIEIDGKVYRNIQEQVKKNMDDIEDLDERVEALEESPGQTYTAGAGITIANNAISVDAQAVPFKIDLATVATTGDYDDLVDKPNLSIYAEKTETITKDENGNVNGVLQVAHVQSESWDEDDDCKADIYLSSGERRSTLRLESDGEETGSSITLQGTTSVGSEGTIEIAGETNFVTENRLTVNGTEEIAYLSDISGGGSSYTAGAGISIANNVISVDNTVALKTDLPAEVSGTNDGTNWTTITIGDTTKSIPQGGSSSGLPYVNRIVSYTTRPISGVGNYDWFMNVPLLLTNKCTDSATFGHPIIDLDTTAANNRIGIEGFFCMRDTANNVTTLFYTSTSSNLTSTTATFRTFVLNRKENSSVNAEKCRIRNTGSITITNPSDQSTATYTAYRLEMTANPDLKLSTEGGSQLISLSVGNFDKNSNVTYIDDLPSVGGTYVLKATVDAYGICTGISWVKES